MNERRRYVARMSHRGDSITVNLARDRSAKHQAVEDLARAIEKRTPTTGTPAEWTAWALRLPRRNHDAPDGSRWWVQTLIDYV